MRSALLILLLLAAPSVAPLLALAEAPSVAHVPRPAPKAGVGGKVEVLAEAATGLSLRWTATRGEGRRVMRVALPPGSRAILGLRATVGSRDVLATPAEAAFVAVNGVIRRLPFADIVLDADALPPGPARARVLEVRFAPGAPDAVLPPAVQDDSSLFASVAQAAPTGPLPEIAEPLLASPDAPATGLPRSPARTGSGAEPIEREMLRLIGFANADSAAGFLDLALASPQPHSVRLRAASPGNLRRSLAAASASGDARSGLNAARLRPSSVTGFEAGRVKFVVGVDEGSGRGGAGIYRITGAQLQALGVDLSAVPTADLRLVTHGFAPTSANAQEVALRVEDGGDGRLDAADFIEFWGEPILGEDVATGWQGLDYTDVNAYVLDAAPGARLRMATRDATPLSARSLDYLETMRLERDTIFVGNHRTGEYNVDHYYWCGVPALEWQTGNPPIVRDESIPAEGVRSASSRSAELRVRLLARSAGSHRSEVDLNGSLVSTRTGSAEYVENHVAAGVAAASLSASANTVSIRIPGGTSSPDRFELDWIELDYPRAFIARAGRLDFRHEPGASVQVAGLGASPPTVLDLSDPLEPVLLNGASPSAADWAFELGAAAPARYAIAAATAPQPTAIEWIADKGLADPSLAVDVVLMGPRAWIEPPLPAVSRWIADREAQGLSVLVAPTEDVIDEYNDGVFSPVALGWMLVDAFASWARPPRYALLLGDATFDWKDNLAGRALQTSGAQACQDMADPCIANELAWCQHVPTRLFDVPGDSLISFYASDVILAIVSGADWVPDVALGRIPARSAAEVEAILDKVLAYEQLRSSPPAWASRIATCADQMAAGEEAMEQSQDTAYAAHAAPTWPRTTYYYQSDYIDQGRASRTEFRSDFVTRDWPSLTDGFAVASYVGHGNSIRWSNAALLTNRNGLPPSCENDAKALEASHVAGGPLPFMVNANCITGSFIGQLGPGLLEEMVRQPTGGLIAAIGPTGITDLANASPVVDSFYAAIHGPDGRGGRVGDVLLGVQYELSRGAAFDASELLNTVLLGDPTVQLVVPFGPPSGSLRAVGGNARVDLDWDAAIGAPAGTTYNLWRSTSVDGPWTRIASGLTALTHADIAAPPTTPDPQNGQRYWYSVEPVSSAGWPGRWSNRADARPCGPDVPAPPSNLAASAGPYASTLTVTWTPSPSSFLEGYRLRLYRGTSASGALERTTQSTGSFAVFSGLTPCATYTVAVSALTWCNVESPPIERLVPLSCPAVLGMPEWIRDLRVRRAGTDLVLDWSPVTSNVRGEALTPALYRVYRADQPDFFADASREIPSVTLPGTSDAGRVFTGASLEFYAVAAESSAGERGAVGHDYPQGVRQITKADRGADWEVSWPLVRHDIDGFITPIASYLVYVRPTAFTDRSDIAGLTPRRVLAPPILVPKVEGDFHLVVPEDVHGNQSVY